MLVISCHADTGFRSHRLRRLPGGVFEGHLDNFVGVHAVMEAYFSGRLDFDHVRIELTYGEERGMAGACEVLPTLRPRDVVLVIDVTGTATRKTFVVEKCRDERLRTFLRRCLRGMSYDLYEGCLDPISTYDETEVYSLRSRHVCFIGLPCWGGNYNRDVVQCRQRSVRAVANAICRIAEAFPSF